MACCRIGCGEAGPDRGSGRDQGDRRRRSLRAHLDPSLAVTERELADHFEAERSGVEPKCAVLVGNRYSYSHDLGDIHHNLPFGDPIM